MQEDNADVFCIVLTQPRLAQKTSLAFFFPFWKTTQTSWFFLLFREFVLLANEALLLCRFRHHHFGNKVEKVGLEEKSGQRTEALVICCFQNPMNNLQLTFIMHHAILNATMEGGLLFKTKTFSTSMMTKKKLVECITEKKLLADSTLQCIFCYYLTRGMKTRKNLLVVKKKSF